jgi:hypothetical protein
MRDSRSTSSAGAVSAELIIELISEHQPVSAEDLLRLLAGQLPAGQAETQQLARIHNQLRHLVDVGKIGNKGSRRYSKWGLV